MFSKSLCAAAVVPALTILLAACAAPTDSATGEEDEDAVDTQEEALATYRIRVRATPSRPVPNQSATVAINVSSASGSPITSFDLLHTKPMHLVAVSSDFVDFLHLHPTLGSGGTLTTTATFARAQPYKLFFEYDPAGVAGEHTSRATLRPVGAYAVSPNLAALTAFDGGTARSVLVAGTRVELLPLAHPMIMPGTTTTLRIAVKTSSGSPALDLTDWLGMPGHVIVLSENAQTFIHAHAMRAGTGGGGGGHGGHGGGGVGGGTATPGMLTSDVKFPSAGRYKIFVQVQRGGQVVTAPFVVAVSAM